tara:strand:+ start:198 stop:677 length:480 start_codon:yes stop_codon:yes gene_type:complete
MKNKPFDLLILDIDGVMTSGHKFYDNDSNVIMKAYSDLDFTAIKRFKLKGFDVCFLSGDCVVNKAMAKKRKVDFYNSKTWVDGSNKEEFIEIFSATYNTSPERMAYVGDDFYDTGIMKKVGFAYCPKNSPRCVKKISEVLDVNSGEAVVACLYDLICDD